MKKPNMYIVLVSTKIGSIVILTYLISVYLVRHSNILELNKSELASLLFGSASLALAAFTAIVAVVAIAGWQSLKTTIQDAVRDETNRRVALMENELKGRVLSGLGFMAGEMSVDPENLTSRNKVRLTEAVRLCEQGYKFLKEAQGPAKYMSLNNLVFYACILGDKSRKEFLLRQAEVLREVGHEQGANNLLLTATRVFLQYGSDAERQAAHEFLTSLRGRSDLPEKEMTEISIYSELFPSPSTETH